MVGLQFVIEPIRVKVQILAQECVPMHTTERSPTHVHYVSAWVLPLKNLTFYYALLDEYIICIFNPLLLILTLYLCISLPAVQYNV